MSIFKETFPKFVQEQLKKRGDILSSGIDPITGEQSGQRSNDFYTYTINKQAFISLASAVEIKDKTLLEDLEALRVEDPLDGDGPAYNFLLKGGYFNDESQGRGGFSTGPEVKEGILDTELGQGTTMDDVKVNYYKGAYGSTRKRGDAKDGFGIVPSPGIIDAQIRTKSAYGSLREGKVKFVCYNKRQLSILELLYMRPGYTLLLEWGWYPYIKNNGETSDRIWRTNTYKFLDKNSDSTLEEIEHSILKMKEESGGNYDALIGYCKNFSYSLRDDGGYDCETEIIAKGEVIESLKDVEDYGEETDPEETSHSIEEFLNEIINYNEGMAAENANFLSKIGVYLTTENNYSAFLIEKGIQYSAPGVTKSQAQNPTKNTVNQTYIRWDAFAHGLNSLVPKGTDGQPLFQIQTYHIQREDTDNPVVEPLLYGKLQDLQGLGLLSNINAPYPENHLPFEPNAMQGDTLKWDNYDCSTNPNVCIMPTQFQRVIALGLDSGTDYKNRQKHPVLYQRMADKTDKTIIDHSESSNWYRDQHSMKQSIGETMLCAQWLLKKFKEMYYDMDGNPKEGDEADFNFFKYIEAIWDGVQGATRGHNMKLNTDNRPGGEIIRVIDMAANGAELDLNNIHELKIQTLDSTVREVVYNTTIPSALSSTIAIAAQAPGNISDLDKVSFAAINRGIQDKFNRKYDDESSISKELQEKYNKRFDKALEDLSLAIYSGGMNGNVSDWKTDKKGFLLLYNQMSFFTDAYYENYEDDDIGGDVQTKLQKGVVAQRRKAEKAISILRMCFASTNEEEGYYRGQYCSDASPQRSAIIPLKFNAKMDGISGLVIGNVFKLPKSKLPDGYASDDIFFIVMGEEQSISSAQDWTTTISGHLILLGGETPTKQKKSWENADIEYRSQKLRKIKAKGELKPEANTLPDKESPPTEKNQSDACKHLIKKNNELRVRISGRTGTFKDSNNPANVPRHALPGGKEQCVVSTGSEIMVKLVPLLKTAGYVNPAAAAAGIVGNMYHESSFGITRYGDNGNAVGLCQWNGTRFDSLVATGNWDNLEGQLAYLMSEFSANEKGAGEILKTATNATEAALAFLNEFERSQKALDAKAAGLKYECGGKNYPGANLNTTTGQKRSKTANGYYNDYVNATPDIDNVNKKDVELETTDDLTVGGRNIDVSTLGPDAFKQQHGDIQGYMIKDGTIPSNMQSLFKAKGAINYNLYVRAETEWRGNKQYITDFKDKKTTPYYKAQIDDAVYLNYTHYYTAGDKRSGGGRRGQGMVKRIMVAYSV